MVKRWLQGMAHGLGYQVLRRRTADRLVAQLQEARTAADADRTRADQAESALRTAHARLGTLTTALEEERRRTALLRQDLERLSPPRSGSSQRQGAEPETPADFDAADLFRRGRDLETAGDRDGALRWYRRAVTLVQKYGPAKDRMNHIGVDFHRQAEEILAVGLRGEAKPLYVRAIELHPDWAEPRARLQRILDEENSFDLTRQCMVYHDPVRGRAVYHEAFLRCHEYLASAGILGECLEFGVLGGFTARVQCEIMRDLFIFRQLHLFDSFDGLPEYTSPVDAGSWDIAGRNVWADRMRFSDDFVARLGEPVHQHIHARLCDVLPAERLFVYPGFFAETLRQDLPFKAALLHVDCDLYQSTREVLTRLYEMDVLQDGMVILFDDYNCFRASPNYGERRAFREFLEEQDRYTASPFFTYGFNGAAFFLHDRNA